VYDLCDRVQFITIIRYHSHNKTSRTTANQLHKKKSLSCLNTIMNNNKNTDTMISQRAVQTFIQTIYEHKIVMK